MAFRPQILAPLAAVALAGGGCSSPDDPKELRRQNETAHLVTRADSDQFAPASTPVRQTPPPYAWREKALGQYSRITKEYFRCGGSSLNPDNITETPDGKIHRITDCSGGHHHSLPLIDGKEHIYPILIELLNTIQDATGRRVVVTCGHRCPLHNGYSDDSTYNATSKHMIGAEVDFYVQGMEDNPEAVLEILFDHYRKQYPDTASMHTFERYTKPDTNVSTLPWYNKEVFIKLFTTDEGRDLDNRHPYPYLSIQVRWDRDSNTRVNYTWNQAHRGYLKS